VEKKAPAPGPEEEKTYRLWDGREEVAAYARDQGLAPARELALGAGIRMGFVLIPAAEFVMGSPEREPERREEYEAVIGPGSNRSQWRGNRRPVERISYYDALEFCSQLNRKTRRLARLPREAEWELACRAGTQGAYHFGARIGPELANYESHKQAALSESREGQNATLPVGSFPPNAWGLHDMHGNVWEWCADWYGEYGKGPVSDPLGPALGTRRVQRGGSWYSKPKYCRAACRDQDKSDDRDSHYGFRVLLEVD
jgi:formylglycine-generating enzyme required for sulfatase activity